MSRFWRARTLVGLLVVVLVGGLVVVPVSAGSVPLVVRAVARPAEVSALDAARASGQRVEVVERRSETSQVFANPSGTLTFERSVVPVRVRRGDGWVPVDTTLVWSCG